MATTEIKLPELGEGISEGELVKWLVKPGDTLKVDQTMAEVMTDKATVEVPSTIGGKVVSISAKEGDVVKVGQVLLTLETSVTTSAAPSAHSAQATKPSPTPSTQSAAMSATSAATVTAAVSSSAGMNVYPPVADSSVLATPSTRRLARELNVDINAVTGTGLAGRVTREDVLSRSGGGLGAVAAGAPSFARPTTPRPTYQGVGGALETREPIRGIRKKIAEKMQLSKQVIPHFTIMDEANVTALVSMREDMKKAAEAKGVKVTYLPFVMKALIATCREFPMLNASIDDAAQEIVYKNYFNLGFAADTPQGLVVPVIKGADQKSILEISSEIVQLSEKARANKLAPEDMKNASITITNIGSIGGTYATPVINHPEVAIFGMYKIVKRPVWDGNGFKPVDMMNVSLTADHRLIDGAVAARFLKAVVARLENPGVLMLDLM